MIVVGSAVTDHEMYQRYAAPGIARATGGAAGAPTRTIERPADGSIFHNYNAIMDEAAKLDDLEVLVLLHQDAEIVDPAFVPKLRAAMTDPEVGVVGCVGAV